MSVAYQSGATTTEVMRTVSRIRYVTAPRDERFQSRLLPLFTRRTKGTKDLQPDLYLHGFVSGEFELALGFRSTHLLTETRLSRQHLVRTVSSLPLPYIHPQFCRLEFD